MRKDRWMWASRTACGVFFAALCVAGGCDKSGSGSSSASGSASSSSASSAPDQYKDPEKYLAAIGSVQDSLTADQKKKFDDISSKYEKDYPDPEKMPVDKKTDMYKKLVGEMMAVLTPDQRQKVEDAAKGSGAANVMDRSKETANRVQCASHLKTIGTSLMLYAAEHAGKFPDSLSDLKDLKPEDLVCPSAGKADYVYVGKGHKSSEMTQDSVLAYEPLENHGGQGMNVLYGDDHVDWVKADEAKKLIEKIH